MVWVVFNEDANAWGAAHPRPGEGKRDLQVEGFGFQILTDEERAEWETLSPGFKEACDSKRIVVRQMDSIPKRRRPLPPSLRTSNTYDMRVAFEIAFAGEKYDDIQFARINLWKTDDPNRVWDEEANMPHLRTRHRSVLKAAEWYLENYPEKRTPSQNRRLKDIKRQVKAIDQAT